MQATLPRGKTSCNIGGSQPLSLDHFVGQQHVVAAVKVALDASRNDGTHFPHSLFVGPPGLGKSNLVQIIANELGVKLNETLGQSLVQSSDVATLLLEAESRQVVFIDESDEMEPAHQTLLYRALAEGKLFLPRGRSSGSARCLPLENFTLVMATNHEGKLARPLVERFKIICRFGYYRSAEIRQMLVDRLSSLEWRCDDDVLPLVAQRSRGVPRIALRLLESVHRIARSERADVLTPAHFNRMCQIEGIDKRGLDRTEQAYLSVLAAAGKAVRLGVIADRLGLPIRTISGILESFLIREGLINRNDDGRELTPEGVRYVTEIETSSASN